jgi:hypothetical protein
VATFIVESYGTDGVVADQRRRAERAAAVSAGIRYVRTTIVPGDQTLLHLFVATSQEALRQAVAAAALDCDRIVEVVEERATTETRPRRARGTFPRPSRGEGGQR